MTGMHEGAPRRPDPGASVTLRYWAGAQQAAGCPDEPARAGLLAQILGDAVERHPHLEPVLAVASILVDGVTVSGTTGGMAGAVESGLIVAPGATVEVLPPFSGG
ncbi:MAG TPA: MoaD/ThiS family protein [Dermatophilaceae bacterium]|nr:MoaD/ThiS family protein [Dermatophilaceae bacterium]